MKKIFYLILIFVLGTNVSIASKSKRNLLQNKGEQLNWQEIIKSNANWFPFPSYYDREAWNKIDQKIRDAYIEKGEKYLDYDWPTVPASTFLDFVRTGSRDVMQRPYGRRKSAFTALVMAELMEGKGRFIDQIINGIWVYCEQTYWGLSAHLTLQKVGAGLPDYADPTIDLGVGQIAANLAWTYHFFNKEFDKVSPLINKRLTHEMYTKVITPFYTRNDFWWQGFRSSFVNNWNPWCNYNALNCIAIFEKDPIKKEEGIKKVLKSVDQFINYYHNDGGCEEGPGYWGHAGGKLFDVLHLLHRISGGELDIFENQLIKNMGSYIAKAYIATPYYINFADASAKIHTRAGTIYRFGKYTKQPELQQFGSFLAQKYKTKDKAVWGKIELALDNVFEAHEIADGEAYEPQYSHFWLKDTEIMGARDQQGSSKGFYFAAKGGYNNESHNHNDAGSCIMYYDGEPILADAGVGTYTRKTFSAHRYDIWTMQSQYHNLPQINGVDQKNGYEYKARNCTFRATNKYVRFSAELAGAYPKEAAVKSWVRSYQLNRKKSFVITDSYQLEKAKEANKLFFITPCDVTVKGNYLILDNQKSKIKMAFDSKRLIVKVEKREIRDNKIKKNWNKGLNRIVFTYKQQNTTNKNMIKFTALK